MNSNSQCEMQLADTAHRPPCDAQSDPEPAVPSLPEPDLGVFHHEPPPFTPAETPTKPASPATKDDPA